MKLSPRVLPGALHQHNKGACDWGWQSLIAYGCHNHVVIFDPKTIQAIQILDLHTAPCRKVKWGKENYHHDFASPYNLRLASGDSNGRIVVWDVALGKPIADFMEGNRPVLDLEWLSTQDACHDLLAALHSPSCLVLWNADTGTKLWKKSFQENVLCFAFDPFCPSHVTLMCQDWILFIDDFSINKAPESNGRRFYLTSSGTASPSSSGTNINALASRSAAPKSALARVKLWAAGEPRGRSGEESVALSECLQLVYLPSCNHHLLVLFPREVMILDMEINQAVCSFCLERNSPSFIQIIPCRQRDVLMCLHENGSIIMRSRRRITQNPYFFNDHEKQESNMSVDIVYETKCQSDTLRLSKSSRLHGFLCCPTSEKKLALLISDGRILIWDLKAKRCQTLESSFMSQECIRVSSPVGSNITDAAPSPVLRLADVIPPPLTSGKVLPQPGHFKFIMTGIMSAVAAPPTCAVMCPPLTTKNWSSYKPLIAIGTNQGSIQVFNLSTGILTREYSIHTGSVRGVSWSSLSSFFSWSLTPGSSSKNELQLLDLKTGHSTHISLGKHAEEVPIECVKVSQLRQYFFIAFKDRPLQLWDLKNLCVLKELPRNFPNITALEWSPSHHSKHLKKKLSSQLEASGASDIASHVLDPKRLDPTQTQIWIKEHFVCVDVNGLLYHFLVEGNNVKDGSKVQCDSTLGVVQCMAWKGDIMVLADNEGNLSIWELKARVTRLVATHRGCIKKIKFAPGRGNLKLGVLFTDGMDVWDLQSAEMYSSYKIPKDSSPTVDLDWLASDLPLIVQASGCLQVMDMELQSSTVAMASLSLHDSIWCPHILESKTALILKTILQHHLGREPCSLTDISDLELQPELEKILLDQLFLVPKVISDYVPKTPMGTAEKCLLTAHLFGDEAESVFWDVALHYLRREKARLSCPLHKTNHKPPQATSRPRSSSDLFNPSDATAKIKRSFSSNSLDLLTIDDDLQITAVEAPGTSDYCCCLPVSLDMCFEILCDSDAFQKAQLDRIALHDSKRSTYEHTRKCAEALVLLGQADRAVQLFLETESSNDNYYVDSLRACLVATIRSSGASQSTIKLVATNLIASGKLAEGVQLLCLIDKGLDACRYLQTYGEWEQAASLAKATLNYPDCAEVMRRWIEHLSSTHTSQQSKAILVLLSLGQFHKVLEMLHSMRYFDRAALFSEACQEFGFDFQHDDRMLSLVDTVNAEYARYLQGLGLKKPAVYFDNKAGDKGKELLEGMYS